MGVGARLQWATGIWQSARGEARGVFVLAATADKAALDHRSNWGWVAANDWRWGGGPGLWSGGESRCWDEQRWRQYG